MAAGTKHTSITRDRGVTTIPAAVRERAAIRTDTPLTWVEVGPQLWLVGPEARHPEAVAAQVKAALAAPSPFPKLMGRLAAGAIATEPRTRRGYDPADAPALSEAQMIALGTPAEAAPRYRRGRG